MIRPAAHLAAAVLSLVPGAALAQTTAPPAKPAATAPSKPPAKAKAPAETRFRLVLNFAAVPGTTSYSDLRTPTAYAETAQIRTSYDGSTGLGLDAALQASLHRGLGLLVGYSYTTRDATARSTSRARTRST